MIQPLRNLHRCMFAGLAAGLPLLLGAAFWVRPPDLLVVHLPLWTGTPGRETLWEGEFGGAGFRGHVKILGEKPSGPEAPCTLEVTPSGQTPRPEILIYWTPWQALNPESSRFIGSVSRPGMATFTLPGEARGGGRLFFYSLAQRELRGHLEIPPLP